MESQKPTNSDYEPEWNKQIVKVMSKLPFKGAKLDKESTENELIIDIVFDITKPKKERCNVRFTITPCLRRNFLVQCKSDSTTGESAVSKNSTKSYKFIVFFELLFLKYAKINLYSVRRPLVPRDSIAPTWSDFSIRRGRSKLLHPLVCKRNGVRCSLFFRCSVPP